MTQQEKKEILTALLEKEEITYADSFNGEILLAAQNVDFKFLEKFDSEFQIFGWLRNLKSDIVMREDEAMTNDVINEHFSHGPLK